MRQGLMRDVPGLPPGPDARHDDTPVSEYREFAPPAPLETHLLCVWVQSIGDGRGDYLHRVLPDGCVDIVWVDDRAPVVAGPATRAFIAPLPPRSIAVGARCRPGLAASLLGQPAAGLLDQEVALRDVCRRLAERLSGKVAEERSAAGKLAAVEAGLATHLADARPADDLVTAAVGWLARHPGGRVHDLTRSLDLGSRQLQRRFRAAVGYGPKTFHRILRFQRLLALAREERARGRGLSSLALEAGYADQAHMTREVHRLAGRQPTTLLSRVDTTLAMSDFFKRSGVPPRRWSGEAG
jgi:AraC-like DNA-binding protein